MRLVRFTSTGSERYGLLEGEQILALPGAGDQAALEALMRRWAQDPDSLIAEATGPSFQRSDVELLAPVPRPGKIFAIGLNYRDHIEESGMDLPQEQVWFTKAATAITGPTGAIEIPRVSGYVDYEVELVAVIGRAGRHIAAEDAPAHVFGYCVGNDVTERLWQHRTPQWSLGKSFDTHAPIGPWITTADAVSDPHALGLRCLVNGETRQSSNTRHLVFNLWSQIEHLSQAMTLEPGDLLFTGTPAGVGAAMDPRQFLRPGDVVRCEIDELGHIENRCAEEH